jgi:hypothetical protein
MTAVTAVTLFPICRLRARGWALNGKWRHWRHQRHRFHLKGRAGMSRQIAPLRESLHFRFVGSRALSAQGMRRNRLNGSQSGPPQRGSRPRARGG